MKRIITPKRVSAIIISIFIIFTFCGAPNYTVNRLSQKFVPSRNKTLIGRVLSGDQVNVEKISFAVNFFLPLTAFVIIMGCTIILALALRKRTLWLRTSTTSGHDEVSKRSQRVSKMVLMVSVLFISCFVPNTILLLVVAFEPDVTVGGKSVHIGIVMGGVGLLIESVNYSTNIFIYYYMSTKYKQSFREIFWRNGRSSDSAKH